MNAFGIESMPDLPSAYQREKIREAAGLSEKQLAAMVGVSDLSIRIWEAGVEEPSGMWSRRHVGPGEQAFGVGDVTKGPGFTGV